jgi:hypothetical protein
MRWMQHDAEDTAPRASVASVSFDVRLHTLRLVIVYLDENYTSTVRELDVGKVTLMDSTSKCSPRTKFDSPGHNRCKSVGAVRYVQQRSKR